MREALNQELSRDVDQPAHYKLAITLREVRFPQGVRVNNVSIRYEMDVTDNYTLTDASTAKVVYTGRSTSEVSYDSADPPYAGVAANQDGEQRIARQVAIAIRLALSRYFDHQATPGA